MSPLPLLSIFCFFLSFGVFCSDGHSAHLQWVRLTNDNFTSDIHTHPFLLCIATVPWCGESRSIMRTLSKSIEVDEKVNSVVQLRVVYVNIDKILDLGRAKYPTLTFFWHSIPFQYKGKLKEQNILEAIHRALSFNSWDAPFKRLETNAEVDLFMESTDKAVILFDFCNYSEKVHSSKKQYQMLDKLANPLPVSSFNVDMKEIVGESSHSERREVVKQNNRVLQEDVEVDLGPTHGESSISYVTSSAKYHLGNMNKAKQQFTSCQPETDFWFANSQRSFPWMQSVNLDKQQKVLSAKSVACDKTNYKRFLRVYRNLTNVVKTYALTPGHANIAIIKDKSLLAHLGIEKMHNYSWFLMQWMADQPNLGSLYFENEMLDSFLSSSEQLVFELNREVINQYSALFNQTSAVILFIDRAASDSEVRRKSWEALKALRAFARDFVRGDNNDVQVSSGMYSERESKAGNEDKSDICQSGTKTQSHTESLPTLKDFIGHETLQYLTDQPFNVINDLTGKDRNVRSGATEQGSSVLFKILVEGDNKLQLQGNRPGSISDKQGPLDLNKVLLAEGNVLYKVQKEKIVGKADIDHILSSLVPPTPGSFFRQDSQQFLEENKGKKMIQIEDTFVNVKNALSFYFADGEDQWKDLILPGLSYPSLVILDSSKGGQFVFPDDNQSINHTSLKAFIEQFSKDKLQKTFLSESAPQKPRKHVRPPFVNRDFHEVDGAPRVSTENLLQILSRSEMLEAPPKLIPDGTKKMDLPWKRDTLVLFTTPSCGFCKRMELVFREVYQLSNLKMGSHGLDRFLEQMAKDSQEGELVEGASTINQEFKERFPWLLQIDCTSNDCSTFFNSINQKELYPSIILYLGENKESPVVFEGGPMVQEILNFIATKGNFDSKFLHIIQGFQNGRMNSTFKRQMGCRSPPMSSKSIHIDANTGTNKHAYHFTAEISTTPSSLSDMGDTKDQDTLKPIIYPTIGSVLLATDQLSKVSKVFESSSILIVKADGQQGFQGLIINKPIAWNRLPGLNSDIEALINSTVLCYGGPVLIQGQPFSSLSRLKDLEGFSEVVLGVYYGGPSATMRVLRSIKDTKLQATDFWFFLGHAVWGWQQLLNEISEQSWNLTSYEEFIKNLPVHDWLQGSTINVSDLLKTRDNA